MVVLVTGVLASTAVKPLNKFLGSKVSLKENNAINNSNDNSLPTTTMIATLLYSSQLKCITFILPAVILLCCDSISFDGTGSNYSLKSGNFFD